MTPSPASPNDPPRDLSRRAFMGTLTSMVAVGFALQIVGCIEEDPVSPASPTRDGDRHCALAKTAADRTATGSAISGNHGHSATVTTAQQDAGTAFNLGIQGSAGHNHTLALTTQDIATLKSGAQLVKATTGNDGTGHSHTVTFAAVSTSIWKPNC